MCFYNLNRKISHSLWHLGLVLMVGLLLYSCATPQLKEEGASSMTIAFGSCNKSDLAQPLWTVINKQQPDLFIWLGDIVYGDTESMSVLSSKYHRQKQQLDYIKLRQTTEVVGIWDDHDYGIGDGGIDYPMKDSSKLALFEFLDVPAGHASRQHEGAYQLYDYEYGTLSVRLFLLDVRYYRDTVGSINANLLGNTQWSWLIQELTKSTADVNILAGGSQFLPTEHQYEKWADYPSQRERLIQIIDRIEPSNPILLSGDRHFAEISMIVLPNGNPLAEITSSGMTHSYTKYSGEPNQHRFGPVISTKNFGVLKIRKTGDDVQYEAEIINEKNKVVNYVESHEMSLLLARKGR